MKIRNNHGFVGAVVALAVTAAAAVPVGGSVAAHAAGNHEQPRPVEVRILTPRDGGTAGRGGDFNVDVSLRARNAEGNTALGPDAGYRPFLNVDTAAPGPNAGAPGLVVLVSTTPSVPNTPLVGPNTNLAGVFQLNNVETVHGLIRTFNDWEVTSPGFFGRGVTATVTVFVVAGTAPASVPPSGLTPISNVARARFTIAP